jgi:cell division transport system permease protein
MGRLQYLIREALGNIRLNKTTTVVAVATTAFTLACLGVFLLLYFNVRGITRSLQDEIKVVVYLDEKLTSEVLSNLQAEIRKAPEAASWTYVSKEQALNDFREQFPAEQHLLQGLGENPLPASIVVTVSPQFRSSESVKRWAERLKSLSGVAQVQYNQDWVENLSRLIRSMELIAAAIGTLLAAASTTIIASTIRLALYARRDELDILRLIGATGTFIRIPYLLEGAILGALGGILALAMLKIGFEVFQIRFGRSGTLLGESARMVFFSGHVSWLLVLAGFLLGSTGSLLSLWTLGRARS